MTPDQILQAIRDAAAEEGRTPGERVFLQRTGLSRSDLWSAGYANYGDAVEAAGLARNKLNAALDTEQMLEVLRTLAVKLGRFPTKGDVMVARNTEPRFPSYDAFFRLSGRSYPNLREMLLQHCQARNSSPEIQTLLQSQKVRPKSAEAPTSNGARVRGYVYLLRHGSDYKIGRSNDVTRRRREFALLLPKELEHVHVIETGDPERNRTLLASAI